MPPELRLNVEVFGVCAGVAGCAPLKKMNWGNHRPSSLTKNNCKFSPWKISVKARLIFIRKAIWLVMRLCLFLVTWKCNNDRTFFCFYKYFCSACKRKFYVINAGGVNNNGSSVQGYSFHKFKSGFKYQCNITFYYSHSFPKKCKSCYVPMIWRRTQRTCGTRSAANVSPIHSWTWGIEAT